MFITTAYITNVFAQLQLLPYTRRAAHRTTVDTSSLSYRALWRVQYLATSR